MLNAFHTNRFTRSLLFCAAAMAVMLGCAATAAAQYNETIFGPNVYVFDPSVPGATINSKLTDLASTSTADNVQFGTNRAAVLFKPGSYTGVNHQVGFYLSIAGLGTTPDAVTLNGGGLYLDATDPKGHVTTNFWRSIENLTIPVPQGGTDRWAVSQGASFRRMHIRGYLELTNASCGYASGGFISDSKVEGIVQACSQQQWYSRNSAFGCTSAFPCKSGDAAKPSFTGGVWNYVFSGVNFQNPVADTFPSPPNTVLPTTPVSREKPFLYIDGGGAYNVFVPALQTNSSGITWGNGLGAGSSLAISTFYIASPSSKIADINAALASGKNLILTPGIYSLPAPISVTKPNTVVLGLGYPTLVPQGGTAAMTVADVDGVEIAAVLIDAGPANSPVLMQVGVPNGTRQNHAANPTTIFDTYFRIGGATAGLATTSLEIDSNNVLLDNIWAWRADHGVGAGWNANIGDHGVVVNGDNVTALGLAVEHYEKSQTLWNGDKGETIFYQSEDPYDVPAQSSWMDGTANGYPSYEVASGVCQHTAFGVGVYSYFTEGVDIHQANAIAVPNTTGITMTHNLIVKLNGSGDIDHILNGLGGPASSNQGHAIDLNSYTGNGTCAAPPAPTGVAINAGGVAVPPFQADADFQGGSGSIHKNVIDTSGVTNPAPAAVYQDARLGTFSYTFGGLTDTRSYTVRLHFAETYHSAAQQRQFNISINGAQVESNFDIFAAARAKNKAVILEFNVSPKGGQIVVNFSKGAYDQAEVSGIEVE